MEQSRKKICGRTDLALEVKESFPEDSVEIEGVRLEKETKGQHCIEVTTVEIMNPQGAEQMGKPEGLYVTLEFKEDDDHDWKKLLEKQLSVTLQEMIQKHCSKEAPHCYFVTGLGNRFATPDALGPYVVENIRIDRHMQPENMTSDSKGTKKNTVCGIVPGVMAQTGIESGEIMKGIIEQIRPDVLIAIDALATCSIDRLCHTIQVTDTGICPGSGIGNHRLQVNQQTMGIPVIAIGVPTVVEANTIVLESMERFMRKQQFTEQEITAFLQNISKESVGNLFVTPKDIEAQIKQIGEVIARGIDRFVQESA